MSEGIQRLMERYICEKLTEAIPTHSFLSMGGGTDDEDAEFIEPPFTVISINQAESQITNGNAWLAQGTAQVITHMSEATPTEHSQLARFVYDALEKLQPEIHERLTFHGIDIVSSRSEKEQDEKIRADVIDFTAAASS
jgi:hypothetical protein